MKRLSIKRLQKAVLALLLLTVPVFAMGCNENDGASQSVQAETASNGKSSVQVQLTTLGFYAPKKPADIAAFTVPGLNGGEFSTDNLKGKITVLNFWAPWCPPCKQEMPELETFYQHFKDKESFQLIATAINAPFEMVSNFITDNGYTFPIYIDAEVQSVAPYASQGIPATYIVNKDGKIIGRFLGAYNFAKPEFIKFIEEQL